MLCDARLEGEQVVLRPVRPSDAAQAFPLIHDRREILDWLVWRGPGDLDEMEEVYSRWITPSERGTNYQFAITERATDRFSGTLSLRFADHPWVGDVGYWLARRAWGRGFASEANYLAAHLAFRHLGARVLTAEVFLGNEASARVLAKNGYEREPAPRMRPIEDHPTEVDREQWIFSLTRSRFERIFARRRPVLERVELEGA